MQGLARNIRAKDQAIQESTVKIELMERRMEAAKKQAETIEHLESELAKIKKQERAYEEAIEQLQTDLDAAEQENAKLKTTLAGQEKQGTDLVCMSNWVYPILTRFAYLATGAQPVDQPDNVPVEGSLETSYLLEQVSPQHTHSLTPFIIISD
jgi:dynactin 1